MTTTSRAHPLHPHTRRSPYFDRTEALGVSEYMPYNHMYMPMAYGRDPAEDYRALTERVTLWDVGAERQTELRGPAALALADLLTTRSLADLGVGGCRYTICCDAYGQVICDPVLVHPWPDVVWLSHGSVDLTLWAAGLALGGGHEVEVSEPDVAPLQVQGPLAPALLRDLLGPALDELRPFRCTVTELAGVECVISRTGWSGGPGYEVYPLSSARALGLWDAIVAAGEPYGLLVTGPNVARAMERGITDISYATNQGLNPLELWQGYLVDLDKGPFIGRDALREVHCRGPARRQVGLLGAAERLPRLEGPWPLRRDGNLVGDTRWASFSFALERAIAIGVVEAELAEQGGSVEVEHPAGRAQLEICPLPFVD